MADIALAYDPARRRCDLVVSGRDFALDATPLSALFVSLGTDRRAAADDALPDAYSETNPDGPASLMGRRGWVGDALDPAGQRIGSRLWLLVRAKASEDVRRQAESILAEATAWLGERRGLPVDITVRWARAGVLTFRVRAGAAVAQLTQAVGA